MSPKLDQGANVNAQEKFCRTPLHWACAHGDAPLVSELLRLDLPLQLELTDDDGLTALHTAAATDHPEVVAMLLGAGADVLCRDHFNSTPLHHAAEHNLPEIVYLLVHHGCGVNILNALANTPLHRACRKDAVHSASALLACGADLR